jgi:hypothetical protein
LRPLLIGLRRAIGCRVKVALDAGFIGSVLLALVITFPGVLDLPSARIMRKAETARVVLPMVRSPKAGAAFMNSKGHRNCV